MDTLYANLSRSGVQNIIMIGNKISIRIPDDQSIDIRTPCDQSVDIRQMSIHDECHIVLQNKTLMWITPCSNHRRILNILEANGCIVLGG
jgi:hypothetical protein